MASGVLTSIIRMTDKLSAPLRRYLLASSSSDPRSSIEQDLNNLKQTLSTIESVIYDAERKEVRDESVKLWLRELKGVAYDAEDVLDEFEYELLKSKMEEPKPSTLGKRKQVELQQVEVHHQPITNSPMNEPSFRYKIASRVKEITERFDEIAKERARLQLTESNRPLDKAKEFRPPTSSFIDKSEVFGREEDSRKVIEMLLSSEQDCDVISVIPIVGMGGVGKTTLVQLVYNDALVVNHFELRVWVSVSESSDVKGLMRTMIRSVTNSPSNATELTELQESLKEVLGGKRFLIVLDDVWSEEQVEWEMLKLSLLVGADGSKVLVTTRIESVARAFGVMSPYRVNCLSDADCWLLFRRLAFDGRDPDENPDLVLIAKRIALKCRGLPLATKVLGGLLRFEGDEETWTEVLESDLWNFEEAEDEILPALKLSYEHLPVHLKRCFIFCSVFPKGFVFKKDQLVRLWMVQGFLMPSKKNDKQEEEVEDVGSNCFDELVWRSFFEQVMQDIGSEEYFGMHDLVHDLGRSIAGQEFCSMGGSSDTDLSKISAEETRHLLLIAENPESQMRFQMPNKHKALRSLFLIYRMAYSWGGMAILDFNLVQIKIPNDFFLNLGCLRTLDLAYSDITELPDSISTLKHLRYLGLRNTKIEILPESVCKLYYLQTLELDDCSNLRELPAGIGNLINLRHLFLPTLENSFICIPSGIGNLTGLQELAAFNIGSDGRHCNIAELRDITSLRGDLHISGLRNVARRWDSKEANLKNKKHLTRLTLDWYIHPTDYKCTHLKTSTTFDNDEWNSSSLVTVPWEHFEDEEMVLDGLQPHLNLVGLNIKFFNGVKFPSWVGDASYSNLVTLRLFRCGRCETLPELGQLPSLKNLYILGLESIRQVGLQFYGKSVSFPALKKLEFQWLPEWEEWNGPEEGVAFPLLEDLDINNCCKLRTIPHSLFLSLKKLDISECKQLTIIPTSSSLTTLGIGGDFEQQIWSQISNLTLLETYEIGYVHNLTRLNLHNLPALKSLEIVGCSQLCSIDCQGSSSHAASSSSATSSSTSSDMGGLHNLTSLEELKIESCPMLQFAEDEQLPEGLHKLDISRCSMLMDWVASEHGKKQLSRVPNAIVEDYDSDEFMAMCMDEENEEGAEEDMDEE